MFGQFVEKRESMQTNNKMAVAPVGKLIWQMSIPPLISMFLQYSYNLIDSAFVARLSENALTAVSLSFPITTLMNATSIWIGVGVNVLIAGYLGQRKQNEANTTVTHGLLLAFGIGALLNLLSLLIMKPYFRAFTNNEEIYQLSLAYIRDITQWMELFVWVAKCSLVITTVGIIGVLLIYVEQRRREFVIALTLGATHGTLIFELFCEVLLFSLLGGVISLLLTIFIAPQLSTVTFTVRFSWTCAILAIGIAFGITLICCVCTILGTRSRYPTKIL